MKKRHCGGSGKQTRNANGTLLWRYAITNPASALASLAMTARG